MRLAPAGALLLAGCASLFGDLDRVIAIEVVGPAARTLQVGESLRLEARAVTAAGDTVPGAVIEWAVLDTAVVAFTLDPASGLIVATAAGTGRVQARYEELRSDPVRITVTEPVP